MSHTTAHKIYQQAKRDLPGKTIRAWGETGKVLNVIAHFEHGFMAHVRFESGRTGMVFPFDGIEVVEVVGYALSLDELRKAAQNA